MDDEDDEKQGHRADHGHYHYSTLYNTFIRMHIFRVDTLDIAWAMHAFCLLNVTILDRELY